jgi:cell division protein FtsB
MQDLWTGGRFPHGKFQVGAGWNRFVASRRTAANTCLCRRPIYDAKEGVIRKPATTRSLRLKMGQGVALIYLLLLAGLALVGPSGVLSWGEHVAKLDHHKQMIASLSEERDVLRNRVRLLDPGAVDPDMAGELLRKNLNVAHPDEVVIELR